MSQPHLHLVSFDLCPFVQRAIITLLEKGVPFERTYIDLANKPDWFLKLSPTGKVPILQVDDHVLFESAVIAEYLDEVYAPQLHPADPLTRAQHRAWIEYASGMLGALWQFYTAVDIEALDKARADIENRLAWLEPAVSASGPYFAGEQFSLVDAAFGPVFRYFPVLEAMAEQGWFAATPRIAAWSNALLTHPSVINAVKPGYAENLRGFIRSKGGVLAARA
ncbi:glutathione S-transferase [Silvimonas terrae]|uniref:glutathione transferase n=1 Tax=Silvimonas terrae TaxID=300266 RepID=A0A840RHI8_9NEIS|nr:glutathione S-transferase family protein [Silvimonas terrae]MBB5191988.1 glutathione S-transferase [Silvimonas terrae]